MFKDRVVVQSWGWDVKGQTRGGNCMRYAEQLGYAKEIREKEGTREISLLRGCREKNSGATPKSWFRLKTLVGDMNTSWVL